MRFPVDQAPADMYTAYSLSPPPGDGRRMPISHDTGDPATLAAMSNLTPRDRERIAVLETFNGRVRHAHRLVEQFASSPREADQLGSVLRRTFGQMKMLGTTNGFDRLSQICASLETTARRGMSHVPKARALREGVGNLTRQVDIERRSITMAAQREAGQTE